MALHVIFDESGIPGVIFKEPREGTEPVEGLTVEFLAANRRRPNGTWVARARETLTAEQRAAERAAKREAVRAERLVAKEAARRERLFDRLVAVAERLDPDFAKAVADIEAEFVDRGDD